jgi:hypothetical protein
LSLPTDRQQQANHCSQQLPDLLVLYGLQPVEDVGPFGVHNVSDPFNTDASCVSLQEPEDLASILPVHQSQPSPTVSERQPSSSSDIQAPRTVEIISGGHDPTPPLSRGTVITMEPPTEEASLLEEAAVEEPTLVEVKKENHREFAMEDPQEPSSGSESDNNTGDGRQSSLRRTTRSCQQTKHPGMVKWSSLGQSFENKQEEIQYHWMVVDDSLYNAEGIRVRDLFPEFDQHMSEICGHIKEHGSLPIGSASDLWKKWQTMKAPESTNWAVVRNAHLASNVRKFGDLLRAFKDEEPFYDQMTALERFQGRM